MSENEDYGYDEELETTDETTEPSRDSRQFVRKLEQRAKDGDRQSVRLMKPKLKHKTQSANLL